MLDTLHMLNKIILNRAENDAYKKIIVFQLLAIRLIQYSHVDILTANIDQVSPHKIEILIVRNEFMFLNSDQMKTLR